MATTDKSIPGLCDQGGAADPARAEGAPPQAVTSPGAIGNDVLGQARPNYNSGLPQRAQDIGQAKSSSSRLVMPA